MRPPRGDRVTSREHHVARRPSLLRHTSSRAGRVVQRGDPCRAERSRVTPGSDLPLFEIRTGHGALRLGVQICRELRSPEGWRLPARAGVRRSDTRTRRRCPVPGLAQPSGEPRCGESALRDRSERGGCRAQMPVSDHRAGRHPAGRGLRRRREDPRRNHRNRRGLRLVHRPDP